MTSLIPRFIISLLSVPLSNKSLWKLKSLISHHSGFLGQIYQESYYRKCHKNASYIDHTFIIHGNGICFPHGLAGIFISGGATIGKNCIVFQQVTIGSNTLADSEKAGAPTLGDNVLVGAGARIIGDITIGDNCRIGAGTTITKSIPPNTVVVSAEPRLIHKDSMDNRFRTRGKDGAWLYYNDGSWVKE